MNDVFAYNRAAWDRQKSRWTVPVSREVIALARQSVFELILTPTKKVPSAWFGELKDAKVLCLASGGGQQAPVLAAAGAKVTSFDASPEQLKRDRDVALREGLEMKREEGDMRDLSRFQDGAFDLVFHPCSNCFVPDPRPVWKEAARVLRPGGALLAGFCLPPLWLVDADKDAAGIIDVAFSLPYSDIEQLPPAKLEKMKAAHEPLSFGHTLEAQLAGQTDAGLAITGFYEDTWEPGISALGDRIALFAATRAVKASL